MFRSNTHRSAPQRGNPVAQRAEIERLSREFGLEAFLRPEVPSVSMEPSDAFTSQPSNICVRTQTPIVVVIKRRRVVTAPA